MENLKRTKITPRDEEHWLELRKPNVNSTDIASILGLKSFNTYAEKWYEKSQGISIEFVENDRTESGKALEPAIAQLIATRNNWTVRPFKDYITLDGLRIGSSFDYVVMDDSLEGGIAAILEIKNVDADLYYKWHNENGKLEAPAHIELQLQTQMLVSGIKQAYIGVLFGGNSPKVLHRKYQPEIGRAILDAVSDFWRRVDNNDAPAWDYANERDQKLISKLYREAKPPVVLDATKDTELAKMYAEYRKHKTAEDLEKTLAETLKANLTARVGEASLIVGDGWAFTLKEQEFGDWTDVKTIGKDDTLAYDALTQPEFGQEVLAMLDNGLYELAEINNNGDFVINDKAVAIGKVVAWMKRKEYKPSTISRVLRDKKIKGAKPSATNFDIKVD